MKTKQQSNSLSETLLIWYHNTLSQKLAKGLFSLLFFCSPLLHAQSFKWAMSSEGTHSSLAKQIALDNLGNYYVVGSFFESMHFKTGNTNVVTSAGDKDLYLAKFNCKQELLWINRIGGPLSDGGYWANGPSLKYDYKGNVYVTGTFMGNAMFTSQSGPSQTLLSSGDRDMFLAKYDSSGVLQWSVKGGGTNWDEGSHVTIDHTGNIVCCGMFGETATWTGTSGSPVSLVSSGKADIFVVKYTSSGQPLWATKATSPMMDMATCVEVDNQDNIYCTGLFGTGLVTFGSQSFNSPFPYDVRQGTYIARMDPNGVWIWVNYILNSLYRNPSCVTDLSGNVFFATGIAATTSLSSMPPGSPITLSSSEQNCLAMFTLSGELKWAKTFGAYGHQGISNVCINLRGNAVISGGFSNTVNFGGRTMTSNGANPTSYTPLDVFIAEYTKNGSLVNCISAGGLGGDIAHGIACDSTGAIYICGGYGAPATFGKTVLINSGSAESFVAKLGYDRSFELNKPAVSCRDTLHSLYPLPGALTFSWLKDGIVIPGETNDSFVFTEEGTYNMIATNSCNESDTSFDRVIVFPKGERMSDKTICYGDSVLLSASGGSSYLWRPSTGLSDSTIANPHANPLTDQTFLVTKTMSSCLLTDTIKVVVKKVVGDAGPDSTICRGDSIRLNATGGGTYRWYSSTQLTDSTIANPFVWPVTDHKYFVKVSNGSCQNTDSVIVFVKHVVADAGSDTHICPGDSIRLNASGGLLYAWAPNPTLNDTSIADPYATPQTGTQYFVKVTDGLCSNTDSVKISISPSPEMNAGLDQSLCQNDSLPLYILGNVDSFRWFPTTGLSDSTILNPKTSPKTTTQYIIQGILGTCADADTLIVTVNPVPTVDIGPDTVKCLNQAYAFDAAVTGADTYSWHPATSLDSSGILNPVTYTNNTERFVLLVTNRATGCTKTDTMWLRSQKPTAAFTLSDTLAPEPPLSVKITNSSIPQPLMHSWEILDSIPAFYTIAEPIHAFAYSGKYKVLLTVTDDLGCSDTSSGFVTILSPKKFYLDIPNVFTPNGDGKNDVVEINLNPETVLTLNAYIWNRWGTKVFEFSFPDRLSWDGKIDGQDASAGVYYFIIEAVDLQHQNHQVNGTITLLR